MIEPQASSVFANSQASVVDTDPELGAILKRLNQAEQEQQAVVDPLEWVDYKFLTPASLKWARYKGHYWPIWVTRHTPARGR